jgi:Uma2 family endonuclease
MMLAPTDPPFVIMSDMATTATSIKEYLSTSYRPDCDYVDGEIQERHVGEIDHSRLQLAIGAFFYNRRKESGISAFTEQRVQVSPNRFRVPDVCVVIGEPEGQILRVPPFVCIEILSPDDRVSRMNERMVDYLNFGVPYVWLLDPQTRKAWQYTKGAMLEVSELRTENPAMVVPVADLFD